MNECVGITRVSHLHDFEPQKGVEAAAVYEPLAVKKSHPAEGGLEIKSEWSAVPVLPALPVLPQNSVVESCPVRFFPLNCYPH